MTNSKRVENSRGFQLSTENYGRWERAVRGSSDGLWEWDLVTNCVWYAPRFLELLGCTREEFPNNVESWSNRLHPEDYEKTWAAVNRHLSDGELYDVRYRLRTNSGDYCWFCARGKAYRDESGRPIYMAGSIRNIDDLKNAEQKLFEKEAQLRQQQKLDAIGALASGIAHEFNNLLQTISGYARFAQSSLSPKIQAHKDLNHVLAAADQATTLTRQLLDFSRFEADNPQHCQIDGIVRKLADMLEPLLPDNIELQLMLAAEGTSVRIDSHQLQQALLNLCINAKDAMPDGGRLQLESKVVRSSDLCSASLPGDEFVQLTVRDTGTGIPQDVQKHIFEPFYTTKDVGKGTGLGLPVTIGVVQQAGGAIECHSEWGQGTTFEITLPTSLQCDVPEATQQPVVQRPFTELPAGHSSLMSVEIS